MPNDSLTELAKVISQGLPGPSGGLRPYIDALFGDRYQKRYHAPTAVREAYALADGDEGVPYAGIINPDNPPSGPYGGTSLVWFPSRESGSLIDFGIGTRGLAPDETPEYPGARWIANGVWFLGGVFLVLGSRRLGSLLASGLD